MRDRRDVTLDTLATTLLDGHPRPGTFYGIGAGPGDPGLVTVRGAALLQRLDVVVVPRAARGRGVVRAAVEPYVLDHTRLLELHSDMPADAAAALQGWRARLAPILEALDGARSVGFATDGDPSLYSTFAHVAAAVQEARPATALLVVPGVTAMAAAAAHAVRPLAQADERLAVLPASRIDDDALAAACDSADTVVLLKPGAAMPRIRALLDGAARGWSVQYARRLGHDGEEHADSLEALREPGDYMALVVLRRPRAASPPLVEAAGSAARSTSA